ncbi:MAG TPA: hypothetical protein VLA16_02795, partial [Ideonella sp.]|nr:hypothetical protein [Ideonella sp.]
ITELKMTGRGLQRWALIQSWSQFVSWLAWLCLAFLAVELVFLLLEVDVPRPLLFAGMAIGTLPSLVWTLPAEFRVRSLRGRDVGQVLVLATRGIGYVSMKAEGQPMRYRQQVPHFVRWREAEIQIIAEGGWLRVAGPEMPLRNLRRELLDLA